MRGRTSEGGRPGGSTSAWPCPAVVVSRKGRVLVWTCVHADAWIHASKEGVLALEFHELCVKAHHMCCAQDTCRVGG